MVPALDRKVNHTYILLLLYLTELRLCDQIGQPHIYTHLTICKQSILLSKYKVVVIEVPTAYIDNKYHFASTKIRNKVLFYLLLLLCCWVHALLMADNDRSLRCCLAEPAAQAASILHKHIIAWHSIAQHGIAQHSMAQHSIAQHSMAQHSIAQHSVAQHSISSIQHLTQHSSRKQR